MENTDETKQANFPYVSYSAFKSFIGHLNDTVVTDQIDNSMMPRKMSGNARYAVTSALKSLGLIDEQGNTTQKLRDIVASYNTKDWPTTIKKYILPVYDDVSKSIDLKSATRKQIEEMFESASAQMKDKYIRFYLSANKDANIAYSPHLKIRRRKSPKRFVYLSSKRKDSDKQPPKSPQGPPEDKITPPDMFDLPIPIAPGSFIRVPKNINLSHMPLITAASDFIQAMAKRNEEQESE